MRLNIDTLKKIESEFGDFSINQTTGSDEIYLRFGYWETINTSKLSQILNPAVGITPDWYYDEDCGNKYYYILKEKF